MKEDNMSRASKQESIIMLLAIAALGAIGLGLIYLGQQLIG